MWEEDVGEEDVERKKMLRGRRCWEEKDNLNGNFASFYSQNLSWVGTLDLM